MGNNVLIENIPNYIANYRIGENCFIQNANLIVTEGRSSFGNGTLVAVLNETGGREVPIFNELSAHLAYIIALYRHFPVLTERLKALSNDIPSKCPRQKEKSVITYESSTPERSVTSA